MATYEIDIPGKGTFRVESQGEMSEAQAYRAAVGQADMLRMADPTTGMSGTEKFLSGAGKALTDLYRGTRQVLTPNRPTLSGLVTGDNRSDIQREIDESRSLDAPLMNTGAGMVGNFVGNAVPALLTMRIPGANTYTGAGVTGGTMGFLQPVATGESRTLNTGGGVVTGVLGQGLGNMIGRVFRPVRSELPAAEQKLAQEATRRGIPLTAGQQTGSRPLQIADSVMENLPFTSGPQLAIKRAQQDAFNREVLKTGGISGASATPTVLAAQKQAVGGGLGDIAKRNSLDFEQGLSSRLSAIAADAAEHLPPDKAEAIAGTIKQILSGTVPAQPAKSVPSAILSQRGAPFTQTVPAVAGQPMLGTVYQGWREPLRALATNNEYGRYFGQIRSAMDDAFRSQLPGTEGQAFRDLSGQYSNIKTIADAMGGAGAVTKRGDISPAQLESALTKRVGREGKALGRGGDLNDLVSIGRQFVSENIPNSGTAQRQFIQSLITGGGGAGVGAAGAMATGNDPLKGAAVGAGVTAGGLLTPRAIQLLMNSPAGQRYLTQGLLPMTAEQAAAINALARAGTTAGLLGQSPQQ